MLRALIAIGLTFGSATLAYAHDYLPVPKTPGATTQIPDISVSRAAYRQLSAAYPVTRYGFRARKGETIFIQMTIPKISRLEAFSPSFSIVSSDANWDALVPRALDRGDLAVRDPAVRSVIGLHSGEYALTVDSNGAPPEAFHEPFTDTDYWIRQTIRFTAPVSGGYEIVVFDRRGATGKYVLATGEKERFTLRDIFQMPRVRREVRSFMERR